MAELYTNSIETEAQYRESLTRIRNLLLTELKRSGIPCLSVGDFSITSQHRDFHLDKIQRTLAKVIGNKTMILYFDEKSYTVSIGEQELASTV